jgi:hypothetical protein
MQAACQRNRSGDCIGSGCGTISSLHLNFRVELPPVVSWKAITPKTTAPKIPHYHFETGRFEFYVRALYDLLYSGRMVTSWKSFHPSVLAEAVPGRQYPVDATTFTGADIGAQINAAFGSLPASGGTVLLPSSATPYVATTQITVRANCRLLLEALTLQVSAPILCADGSSIVGIGIQSIIKPSGHTGSLSYAVTNLGNDRLGEGKATANSNVHLSNFYIDGNPTGNAAHSLGGILLVRCTNCLIEHVLIKNTKGLNTGGIRSFGGTRNTFFHCTAENCSYIGLSIALDKQWNLSHCYAINNGNNGIDTGIGASQGRVVDCEATGNGGNGFNPDTSSDVQVSGGNFSGNTQYGIAVTNLQNNISIVGARVMGNTHAGIFVNNNSNHVTISGCCIADNMQQGILINASSSVTVVGCEITNNGRASTQTIDGVMIRSAGGKAAKNIIVGNTINGSSQRYGVSEDSNGGGVVGSNIIALNYLVENGTGAMHNLSSSTQAFGNRVDYTGVIAFTTPAGFGNGSAATPVTTTTKHTGSGPTTPQTIVKYMEMNLAGTSYWIPLVQ